MRSSWSASATQQRPSPDISAKKSSAPPAARAASTVSSTVSTHPPICVAGCTHPPAMTQRLLTRRFRMLGDHPVDVMLLATDLGVARRFYGGKLGLEVLREDEQFLTFRCGGDSRLIVTKSTTGTADQATKA